MEELYIEGLATHDDPEPCVGARKGAREASVGARAGRSIEPRNHGIRGAEVVYGNGRQHRQQRYRKLLVDPARSKNHGMHGTSMRENREVLCAENAEGGSGVTGQLSRAGVVGGYLVFRGSPPEGAISRERFRCRWAVDLPGCEHGTFEGAFLSPVRRVQVHYESSAGAS